MNPSMSERNFTPNSIAFGSFADGTSGVAVLGQIVQGHAPGAATVVNDHTKSAVIAVPEVSLTPAVPPLTVAV